MCNVQLIYNLNCARDVFAMTRKIVYHCFLFVLDMKTDYEKLWDVVCHKVMKIENHPWTVITTVYIKCV